MKYNNSIPQVEKTPRSEVYAAIQSELEYQDAERKRGRWVPTNVSEMEGLWDDTEPVSRKWTIGGHVLTLRRYINKAADLWVDGKGFYAEMNGENVMDFQRKIAAIAWKAFASFNTGAYPGMIQYVFDREREHQDMKYGLLDDEVNHPSDFIVQQLHYISYTVEESNPDDYGPSLHLIVKIGALAIAAMERWGAPIRQLKGDNVYTQQFIESLR